MNVVPDECLHAVMRGWCEKVVRVERSVMERMKARCTSGCGDSDYLIRSFCKDRNMRAAMSVLRTMRRTGLRPNDRTYNTLMQGWIELKIMDRAMDLFKQMKRTNARPTIVTYTLLISGWARSMKRMDMAER